MHKKILVAAVSVTLLALAACSSNTANTTPTDEGSEYSSSVTMGDTSAMDQGATASISVGIGMPSSDGSMASVGEPNEGTSADTSTDSMGMGQ